MRVLGLDVGARRIGVAAGDLEHGVATCHSVIPREGIEADARRVTQLAAAEGAEVLVVGLPLELDGRKGHRARRVVRFADALARCLPPEATVQMWDERFSTAAAERTLRQAGSSRARRKAVIDAMAAQHILQGWLDAQRNRRPASEPAP